jgi:hypothetical protein
VVGGRRGKTSIWDFLVQTKRPLFNDDVVISLPVGEVGLENPGK